MRIEHHLDIEAPPSVVFALNTDIERWPTLTPTVTSVTRLDEGPLRAGSQALIKQPGQRATVWTVDTLEPDHRFVWSAQTAGLRMVATHLVDPTPTGARNQLRIDLTGPVARLVGPLLRRRLHTVLETENEGFRREALRLTADSVK
jgi:uncharacterized membrane protein